MLPRNPSCISYWKFLSLAHDSEAKSECFCSFGVNKRIVVVVLKFKVPEGRLPEETL